MQASTLSRSTRIGQMFFSMMIHKLYDVVLYGFITPFFWKCPTTILMDNYVDNVSSNHLEIGVGSAYFLDNTLSEEFKPRLALMDLNTNCLNKAAKKLQIYRPEIYHQNILDPIDSNIAKFDSIGMNYVLHCVEGSFKKKTHALQHIKSLLNTGGVFYGATLLNGGVSRSWLARCLMRLLNALCIFSNNNDNLTDFCLAMQASFDQVEVRVQGCAVIFKAVK